MIASCMLRDESVTKSVSKQSQQNKRLLCRQSNFEVRHTLRLYGAFTSEQASILIRARTRHCRLNQYLSRIGIVEEAKCRCGIDDETVSHILCMSIVDNTAENATGYRRRTMR
jgi:hypothetical protein